MGLLAEYRSYNGYEESYTYDGNGNLIQKEYSGNSGQVLLEELVQMNNPQEYLDGLTGSNKTIGESAIIKYVHDVTASNVEVLSETTEGVTTNYVYGLERTAAYTGTSKVSYLYDGNANVAGTVTDGVYAPSRYNPFGEQLTGKVNGYTYNGEYYNANTGMVNLRLRQYEPAMNCFSQKDLLQGNLENGLTQNGYKYVENDPVNLEDPSGMVSAKKVTSTIGKITGKAVGTISGIASKIKAGTSTSKKTTNSAMNKAISNAKNNIQNAIDKAKSDAKQNRKELVVNNKKVNKIKFSSKINTPSQRDSGGRTPCSNTSSTPNMSSASVGVAAPDTWRIIFGVGISLIDGPLPIADIIAAGMIINDVSRMANEYSGTYKNEGSMSVRSRSREEALAIGEAIWYDDAGNQHSIYDSEGASGAEGGAVASPAPSGNNDDDDKEPKNPQKADDKYLKKNDVDAHALKKEYLGKKADIAKYDLYIDKATGRLWIYLKGGKGIPIPTHVYIK